MRWAEFEKSTRAYQSQQQARIEGLRLAHKQRIQQDASEQDRQHQAELDRVKSILEQFRAGDILEAMRDEVWKEGQVEIFECWDSRNPIRGLRLVSDPYPVVALMGEGGKLAAVLEEGRASFEVYVTPDYQHRPTEIHVSDQRVFNIANRSQVSVAQSVRESGLERGLRIAAVLYNRPLQSAVLHPNEESAVDRFNDTILSHVDYRREYGSFPGSIRVWADAIIGELPSSLKEMGLVTPHELRSWAHEIQGSTIIYRAIDRLGTRVGLGLRV